MWIAQRFTDEHRGALDWLNEITDDRINFFGMEIELWRIGTSPVAPNFKVASKPNDWTKSVTKAAANVHAESYSDTKKLQLEYWSQFREHLLENSKTLRPQKALPQHWTNLAIGRSYFHLTATVNTRDKLVGVALVLTGPDAKAHFHLLTEAKEDVEDQFGEALDWDEKPEKKESWIAIKRSYDPTDCELWDSQHEWLKEKLEMFHKAFSSRIKRLDADEYQPDL